MNIYIKYSEGQEDVIRFEPHCNVDCFKLGIIFNKYASVANYHDGGSGFKSLEITKTELIKALAQIK